MEIVGLTSEAGKQLNGCNGVVTKLLQEAGRLEVRVGVDKRVTVKPENVRLVQNDPGAVAAKLGFGTADRKADCVAAAAFREGSLVEVVGIESMQGRELNGKMGTVVLDYETPPDRVKVKVSLGNVMGNDKYRHATLKPCNLRKVTMAGLTDDQRAQLQSLQDKQEATEESMQENVLRSQLNRLAAQERHSGSSLFDRVELAVDAGSPVAGGPAAGPRPGDVVEVSGLSSAAGKQLNGGQGVVLQGPAAEGRAEVRLAAGLKSLRPENLRVLDLASGDRFLVEVAGLQSDTGRALNGQRGIATSRSHETGRFEVKLSKDKTVSLKPENLRLLSKKK